MNLLPKGEYHDRLHKNGGACIDFGWRSNIIVDQCRRLLAAFMLGDNNAVGIRSLALGRGDPLWDDQTPEAPVAGIEQLVDNNPVSIVLPNAALQLSYLDTVGAETSAISHRIQLTAEISATQLSLNAGESFPLREFALFGRIGSDNYMIDYVRHPVMHIGFEDTLTRKIRLVF